MSGGPWALCDRCGFRVRHFTCRTEWSGAFVCARCFDPRPPYLSPPHIDPSEGAPLKNARFEEPIDPGTFITDEEPIDPTAYPRF